MTNELEELQRKLDVMTGKYEIARGIADKSIKISQSLCNKADNCYYCFVEKECDCELIKQMKNQLKELDK